MAQGDEFHTASRPWLAFRAHETFPGSGRGDPWPIVQKLRVRVVRCDGAPQHDVDDTWFDLAADSQDRLCVIACPFTWDGADATRRGIDWHQHNSGCNIVILDPITWEHRATVQLDLFAEVA